MSHKALVFTAPAEPCQLANRQTPKPGPGQVLIKNVAVALNPVDYVIVHLGIWVDHYGYPALAGIDGAGEIVAIGEGVDSKWNVGDRVLYKSLYHPDTMTFQEFSVSDSLQMAKIPSDITFEGAATIPLGFGTAAVGLCQELKPHGGIGLTPPWEEAGYNKYAGQPAIVTAGASSVGQFAIQLLKASGFSPIITTASKHNEEYCLAAGATHVIDYHSVPYAELGAAVKKITSLPVPVIYDAVGWPDVQRALWEILAPQGKLATVFRAVVGEDGKASEKDDGKVVVGVYGSANAPFNYEFWEEDVPWRY